MKTTSGERVAMKKHKVAVAAALVMATLGFASVASAADGDAPTATSRSAGKRVSKAHAKGQKPARVEATSDAASSDDKASASDANTSEAHVSKGHHHAKTRHAKKSKAQRAAKAKLALPALASVTPNSFHHGKTAHRADAPAPEPCTRAAVELGRTTGEEGNLALTRCDGKPAPHALEQLSVLMRPYSVAKPQEVPSLGSSEGAERGKEWLPGVKLVDPALLTRVQSIAEHYKGKKVTIVSGYRPGSLGSYHKDARAVDLRIDGVKSEELVAYCRGMADTGCGYYPNSTFVHIDARPRGTGHVYWIDASAPGESARYVSAWPPAKEGIAEIKRPDHAAPTDEHTNADIAHKKVGHGTDDRDSDDESPMK